MSVLHIIEKFKHFKTTPVKGVFTSHSWQLSDQERRAEYVAFHKSKSEKSYLYGEVEESIDCEEMPGRYVIKFKKIENPKARWAGSRCDIMAYKSLAD